MEITIYPELAPSRCTAAAITPPVPVPNATGDGKTVEVAVALVHAGNGYGASGDTGALLAKPLLTQTQHDRFHRIAGASNIWQRACAPLTGGLPSSNYPAITLHPEDPKHVYVGTEDCGLYESQDFTGLFKTPPDGSSNFTAVSTIGFDLTHAYINDVAVVPETGCVFINDNKGDKVKFAGLVQLCPLKNGTYNATKLPYLGFTGLYSWQVPSAAAGRAAASRVGSPSSKELEAGASTVTRLVYPTTISRNGTLLSLDGGASWQSVLNASTAVAMRGDANAWFNESLHMDHVDFTAGAGDGDTVIVACWVGDNWDKGIGVFKGTIRTKANHHDGFSPGGAEAKPANSEGAVTVAAHSEGLGDYEVQWVDWTGSPDDVSPPSAWPQATGMPATYMYDSKSGRGRIARPDGDKGAAYYYVATQAIGSFRRDIST